MPSHIFIQLGMWEEVSASNQSAYDAAVARWESGDSAGDMTHALDWGQYGDLQRGDTARAEAWIAKRRAIVAKNPDQERVASALPRVEARYVIETRRWKTTPISASAPDPTLYATGLSAAALGELPLARRAADALAALADEAEGSDSLYHRTALQLRIMAQQVAAAERLAAGAPKEGLALLEASVAKTEEMPLPRGPADPLKPAHELYGEALLAAERPDDAARHFEAQLLRTPNRARALLGLARARAAQGDASAAAGLYRRVAALWGDRDVPELEEVRRALAARAK
jgi:tetratricopeptide (TPR) repeat protein